jgi:hypothetical protein
MADEPHDVVKLLIARMESHPEEFSSDNERFSVRWERYISDIEAFGNEADKAALNAKLRDIWMVKIHEKVMDELCNGEERRRKEAEDREYERHLAHAAMQQQQKAYVNQIQGMAGQLYGGGGGAGAGIVGKSYTHAIMDEHDSELDRLRSAVPTLYGDYGSATSVLPVANGGTDSTIIDQIKNMLKKGK